MSEELITATQKITRSKHKKKEKKRLRMKNEEVAAANNEEPITRKNIDYEFFAKSSVDASAKKITVEDEENDKISKIHDLNIELAYMESPISSTIVNKEIYDSNPLKILSLKNTDGNIFVKFASLFRKSLGILGRMALRLTYGGSSEDWFDEDDNLQILQTQLQVHFTNTEASTATSALEVVHVDPFHHRGPGLSLIQPSSEILSVLELYFDCLKFEHHPLFSIEHVLAQKLIDCYKQYTLMKTKNVLEKTKEQLKHLSNTFDKLKSDLSESKNNLKHLYKDPLIQKYHKKISEMRDLMLKETKHEKELIFMILNLWKDIRLVREKMGFINSPVVLKVTKVERNREENEKFWHEQFQLELTNTVRDLEFDYMKQRLEFKRKMESYKENSTSNIILEKPVKPKLLYNKKELHNKVTAILNEIQPAEPKIQFQLNFDRGILSYSISDPVEISRRNFVNKTKFCLLILLDNIIVCKSDILYLNNSFTVKLDQKIAVQTLPRNKEVKFKFFQNDIILHEEILHIPDRNEDITNVETRECKFISEKVIEEQNYAVGSGLKISAVLGFKAIKRLNSIKYFDNYLFTRGKFNLKIGWSVPPESTNSALNSTQFNYDSTCTGFLPYIKNGVIEFDIIRSLVKRVSINDSEQVDYLSKLLDFETILEGKKFPTDRSVETFTNINMNDPRLLLLKLRNDQKLHCSKIKRIPLDCKEISTELLSILKEETNEDKYDLESTLSRTGDIDPLDLQRYTSTKYLKGVYKYIAHNVDEIALKRHQQDLMTDFQITNIRSLFSPAVLKPQRYNRQDTGAIHCERRQHGHDLCVTLVRAFRLPERLTEETVTASQSRLSIQNADAFKITSLRPFVRVSCQAVSTQSHSAVGCNPTWNHTLNLPIRCDLSSYVNINLYDEVREQLSVAELGDGDTIGLSSDTSTGLVHYRVNSRWLASLHVPVSTVISNSVIEGTFKMNAPPTIFGYKYVADRDIEMISSTNYNSENSSPITKDNIYITLCIKINSSCSFDLQHFSTSLESSDMEHVIEHLKKFSNDFNRQFPDRHIQTAFIDTNGKCKCVTHFLQPIPPPDLDKFDTSRRPSAISKSSGSSQTKLQDRKKPSDVLSMNNERDSVSNMFEMKNLGGDDNSLESIMHICARYVSLIPIYEHGLAGTVALKGLELLKLMCGSALDHTLLLTSYFLYLGLKCWILIGRGLPRAYASFVLIRINRRTNRVSLTTDSEVPPKSMLLRGSFKGTPWRYVVWDATTGHRYELRDTFSPLRKVYFAFNEDNIWANVQQSDCFDKMRFDFANTSDWQQTFDKNLILCKLAMCHDLSYQEPTPVDTLRQRIEEKVKGKIQKWRAQRRTIWNRYCSSILREALQQWEAWTLNTLQPKPEPSHRLKQMTVAYNVFGFPLNFPYTNIKTILSSIKGTAFYMSDNSRVEFALGVEVFSYPNDVVSVWLYLATISRRS